MTFVRLPFLIFLRKRGTAFQNIGNCTKFTAMLVFVYQVQCRTQICLRNVHLFQFLWNINEHVRTLCSRYFINLPGRQDIISVASLSFVCVLSVGTVRKEAGYLCNCFNRPETQRQSTSTSKHVSKTKQTKDTKAQSKTNPPKIVVFPSANIGTSSCGFMATNFGCRCSPWKTLTSVISQGILCYK